jgi:hypothetical protein
MNNPLTAAQKHFARFIGCRRELAEANQKIQDLEIDKTNLIIRLRVALAALEHIYRVHSPRKGQLAEETTAYAVKGISGK